MALEGFRGLQVDNPSTGKTQHPQPCLYRGLSPVPALQAGLHPSMPGDIPDFPVMGDLMTDPVVQQEEQAQGPKKFLKKFSSLQRDAK